MQIFFPTEMMDMGISIAGKSFFKLATFYLWCSSTWYNSFLGAVVFSLFIIYDTHMIMRRLSPEEYIFAAINLYLDIINLFLHILKMLSRDQR